MSTAATATSNRQIEANRLNALLSTGPSSPSGKAASSRNALAHGLTSKHPILPGESAAEYQLALDGYVAYYCPADFEQKAMVAELADLRWRLRRIPAYESNLITHEIATLCDEQPDLRELPSGYLHALAFKRLVDGRVLQNLMNQEARLSRRADRLRAALRDQAQSNAQQTPPEVSPKQDVKNEPIPKTETVVTTSVPPSPAPSAKPQPIVNSNTKVGRNEPCPCGSNLKFKRCCGNPVQL